MCDLDTDFKMFFPSLSFRLKDFQKKVVENVLDKGNTLCVMPTGGGKSVIYWLTATELHGITIVVSPLIALIDEQATKLEQLGYEVLVLHSGILARNQMQIMRDFANGVLNPQFIFVSPEKLATDGFFEACLRRRKSDIKLLVIDEVHCVSQWGENFRPMYKRIPDFLNQIYGSDNWIKILALTATLNPKETGDICDAFKIDKSNIIVDHVNLMRSDIQLHVQKFSNENDKEEKFWEILRCHSDEKVLVYVYRKEHKRGVEDLCSKAVEKGFLAEFFHGELTATQRAEIAQRFRSGKTRILFATNAFGMGMDIADIRTVIHFMIPESVEQYYQEIGRAGRDGHGANAYLLYSAKNIDFKRKNFIDKAFPEEEMLQEAFAKTIGNKIGFRSFSFFEDETIQNCFPFFQQQNLFRIECKGFSSLKNLSDIKDNQIKQYFDSTKTKFFVSTIKKNPDLSPAELSQKIYQSIIDGKVNCRLPLDRCLILNVSQTEIDDDSMQAILSDIEEKKTYKHALLDYLVYLIENNPDSLNLHQEIAQYLGVNKWDLNRIYTTADGNRVRSKAEVIISDLLYKSGIQYTYEQDLYYTEGKHLSPDFTLHFPDGDIYWEHIGMLGNEEYDRRWRDKLKIYNSCFPERLIKTYENASLAKQADDIIQQLKKKYEISGK